MPVKGIGEYVVGDKVDVNLYKYLQERYRDKTAKKKAKRDYNMLERKYLNKVEEVEEFYSRMLKFKKAKEKADDANIELKLEIKELKQKIRFLHERYQDIINEIQKDNQEFLN